MELSLKIKKLLPEVMRFSVTGGLSTATHFCTVAFLVSVIRFLPISANIIAFLVAFGVSYIGHSKFTFPSDERDGIDPAMIKFFMVATLSFALNEGMYYYLLNLHYNYLVALVIVITSVSIVTFSLSKFWAFR